MALNSSLVNDPFPEKKSEAGDDVPNTEATSCAKEIMNPDDPRGYEERRAQNIARNKALMESLNFEDALKRLWGQSSRVPEGTAGNEETNAKVKPRAGACQDGEGKPRRSVRLR